MKPLQTFLLALLIPVLAYAGPVSVPSPSPSPTPVVVNKDTILNFAQSVNEYGNFSIGFAPAYGRKIGGGEWGAGLFAGYQINQYSFVTLRAEILDGAAFAASGSMGLKYDVTFLGHVFTPYVEAGVISPITGTDVDKEVGALIGTGLKTQIWKSKDGKFKLDAFGSVETWQPIKPGVTIIHAGVMGSINGFW